MAMTYKEAWNAQPDGRSREEIFQSIVQDMKDRSGGTLSDAEAHQAARNLIAFCRELAGLKQEETIGNLDSSVQRVTADMEQD